MAAALGFGGAKLALGRAATITLAGLALVTAGSAPAGATTTAAFTQMQNFAISRDGTKLAIAGTVSGVHGIYLANRDGSNVTLLAADGPGFSGLDHPDFSPDGQTIAFTAFGNPGGGDVYLTSTSGGTPTNLTATPFDEEAPRFSPDGASIVVMADGTPPPNFGIVQIRRIDVATGDETLVFDHFATYGYGGVSSPTYTSDGTQVLFAAPDAFGSNQIYSIPAAGGTPTQLTFLTNGRSGNDPDSSWSSANAGQVAFTSDYQSLYTMGADGSGLTQAVALNGAQDVHWTPGGRPAYLGVTFDGGEHDNLVVPGDPTTGAVSAGGTLSTDSQTTPLAPVATSVTSPVAGSVTIDTVASDPAPTGYSFLGQQVNITAPDATTADPLVLVFQIDASLLTGGVDATSVLLFRNGSLLSDCDPLATGASPDPCVASRVTLPGGNAQVTVRTSQASHWDFGSAHYTISGFFQPVDNLPALNSVKAGSAIPVKFTLGGNEGLNVFATGFPTSARIVCDSAAPVDAIEQTVSAGSSNLSYDATTNQYTYVWKTDKTWSSSSAGPCRQLVLRFVDGSYLRANFKFGK